MPRKPERYTGRMDMMVPPSWVEMLDDWRDQQEIEITRSDAIRSLVQRAIEGDRLKQNRNKP